MEAWIYFVGCGACGYTEERRVRGDAAPQFGLIELRAVHRDGVMRMVGACPLCRAEVEAGRRRE